MVLPQEIQYKIFMCLDYDYIKKTRVLQSYFVKKYSISNIKIICKK